MDIKIINIFYNFIWNLQSVAPRAQQEYPITYYAPTRVSNLTLFSDPNISTVYDEAVIFYKRFHQRLPSHSNPLMTDLRTLPIPGDPHRMLKRSWCRGLQNNWYNTLKKKKFLN